MGETRSSNVQQEVAAAEMALLASEPQGVESRPLDPCAPAGACVIGIPSKVEGKKAGPTLELVQQAEREPFVCSCLGDT